LKSQVRNSFQKCKNALELREKLLLRQIDVLNRAPDNNKIDFSEITFQTNDELTLLESLRNFGSYQNIDCYLPYLENENEGEGVLFEKSFYDPSSIENKKLSESIINLTLKESQKLITKSSDLVTSVSDKLKLEQSQGQQDSTRIDKAKDCHGNEGVKSIKQVKNDVKVEDSFKLKRNEATTSSKKKTLKNISNLTLNCTGSIVLKNISNLTINTCKQPQTAPKPDEPSAKSKPCPTSKSCDGSFYQCDFYERLISENEVLKRSIVNQSMCSPPYPDPIATACMSPTGKKLDETQDDGTFSINSTADDTATSSVMDEAEDGLASPRSKVEEITTRTMMADNLMNHPPMIQCWLNKMLLETETEAQNMTEFLEISHII
jgi:hypothetical protein